MVLEHALLSVIPGRESDFEEAMAKAFPSSPRTQRATGQRFIDR